MDVNNKINKILGTDTSNTGTKMTGISRQRITDSFATSNFKINPQNTLAQLRNLLDKIPEVKAAKGQIQLEFVDGQKANLNLNYR